LIEAVRTIVLCHTINQSNKYKLDLRGVHNDRSSTAETVERPALPLERIDDIESGDRLSLRVLCVDDGIPDDILKEASEYSARLLIDVTRDALDATSPSQSANRRLRNAKDRLSESLATKVHAFGS